METNIYAKVRGPLSRFKVLNEEFVTCYGLWAKAINSSGYIAKWNDTFNKNYKGKPIEDYLNCQEYNEFMYREYLKFIHRYGWNKSKHLNYSIDKDFQFYGYIGPFKIYWKYFEEEDL